MRCQNLACGINCLAWHKESLWIFVFVFQTLSESRSVWKLDSYWDHRLRQIVDVYSRLLENPFYLFQLYTVIVWLAQQFYDYSCLVIVTTLIAVAVTVCETRKVTIYTFELFPCMVSYFASFRQQMTVLREKAQVIGQGIKVVRNGIGKLINIIAIFWSERWMCLCVYPCKYRINCGFFCPGAWWHHVYRIPRFNRNALRCRSHRR